MNAAPLRQHDMTCTGHRECDLVHWATEGRNSERNVGTNPCPRRVVANATPGVPLLPRGQLVAAELHVGGSRKSSHLRQMIVVGMVHLVVTANLAYSSLRPARRPVFKLVAEKLYPTGLVPEVDGVAICYVHAQGRTIFYLRPRFRER